MGLNNSVEMGVIRELRQSLQLVMDTYNETVKKFQEQLAEEREARLKAEEMASDKNRQITQSLENANRENEKLRKRLENCPVL